MLNKDLHSEPVHTDPGIPISRTPTLAVFGGSFDPIHNGHLDLAQELVDSRRVDEVLFVPSRRPPHKDHTIVSDGQMRLEMLMLAIDSRPAFSVSDIEMMRTEGYSYTFDTLSMLKEVFPEHRLCFLMGMDSLVHLHEWHRAPELVKRFDFLIYPRPGIHCPSMGELVGRFGMRNAKKLLAAVLTDVREYDLSATEIRERVTTGRPVDAMCPHAVSEYISKNGLYREEN